MIDSEGPKHSADPILGNCWEKVFEIEIDHELPMAMGLGIGFDGALFNEAVDGIAHSVQLVEQACELALQELQSLIGSGDLTDLTAAFGDVEPRLHSFAMPPDFFQLLRVEA